MPAFDSGLLDSEVWSDDGATDSSTGTLPEHLAAAWDGLSIANQQTLLGPWIDLAGTLNWRDKTRECVQILRDARVTLDDIIELANFCPHGLGWNGWKQSAGELTELYHEIVQADIRAERERIEAELRSTTFGRLRVLSVEDALNAPARTYLLDGLMAPGEMSVWWGRPKSGKSFLMLRIAYGLALGRGIWGREAVKTPVMYVAAEGASGIKGRIRALHDTMGNASDFHLIAQSVDLFDPEADLSSLIDAIRAFGIGLLVLDTLARIMAGGDESSTRDMSILVRNCDLIREATGVHIAIVHHGGWDAAHSRGRSPAAGAKRTLRR